jgi:hypothetical protein
LACGADASSVPKFALETGAGLEALLLGAVGGGSVAAGVLAGKETVGVALEVGTKDSRKYHIAPPATARIPAATAAIKIPLWLAEGFPC